MHPFHFLQLGLLFLLVWEVEIEAVLRMWQESSSCSRWFNRKRRRGIVIL
jgi:hypothetical protein